MQASIAYRDNQFLPKSEIRIGLDDLGFERGFGVFDYCRIRAGKITFLTDHLERLNHSQSLLQFEQPIDMNFVRETLDYIHEQNEFSNAYFKILITGRMVNNSIRPILTIYQDAWHQYPETMYSKGVSLILEEFDKPFPQYKTTFYLGSFKAQSRMKSSESEDVLFYFNNAVRECARCNIFIVKNGLIYTPDKNMLWGVTRKHVIKCAKETTMVIEKDISVQELFSADEIFITSTTRNIVPIVKIEDKSIGSGKPGTVTTTLINAFEHYCNSHAE